MTRRLFLSLVLALIVSSAHAQKREFRGAWIQCVNGQFQGLSQQTMKSTLTSQLNELQRDGVNAIIFQVRAECDALYQSPYEPWSRFLTGQQGRNPGWDPLAWMVEECHKRGMEIHAWINPYRAKTKGTTTLSPQHIVSKHPERAFYYDSQYILNPGNPINREYICIIVDDIVRRYDVDGLHIDDYFYPYPAAGQNIPDDREYSLYNNGIGNRNDWRRDNVNVFIKQLSDSIHSVKPWVKFGVSPFGIYRNKKSDPQNGSNTNGLQNYDDLYADVLLWVNNGWIDYCVPQLYWEIGHKAADYETLIKWWNKYSAKRPLFIGEDVERTVKAADLRNPNSNQMPAKMLLHQQLSNVEGTCLWYAKAVADNTGNYGHTLRDYYWRYPALQPRMTFIDGKAPKKPRKLKLIDTQDGRVLFWTAPRGKSWKDKAVKYVVYRFSKGESVDLNSAKNILTVTPNTFFNVERYGSGTYVVTALDRLSNESKKVSKKIK